jgi:hypothetical protein
VTDGNIFRAASPGRVTNRFVARWHKENRYPPIRRAENVLKLGTIAQEAKACRKAFKDIEMGALVRHCHHEILCETLTEPAENRIAYILSGKPENEQALRLRLFRPIVCSHAWPVRLQKADADWEKADADWEKAYYAFSVQYAASPHAKDCPDCTWNGRTIFPSVAQPGRASGLTYF